MQTVPGKVVAALEDRGLVVMAFALTNDDRTEGIVMCDTDPMHYQRYVTWRWYIDERGVHTYSGDYYVEWQSAIQSFAERTGILVIKED